VKKTINIDRCSKYDIDSFVFK